MEKAGILYAFGKRYLLLPLMLVFNTFVWYSCLYDTQIRTTQPLCDEDDTSNSKGDQINSDFHQTNGIVTINATNASGELVRIVDTLSYGNQEIAYHMSKTWVCVNENEEITIYGAATNSQHIVHQYRVSMGKHSEWTILTWPRGHHSYC